MWSEHGWKRITAQEATRLFSGGTVSANSKLFRCDLCYQYVMLTDGKERIRYFKHSAYEENKECPERILGSASIIDYSPKSYELPIRLINISDSQFELEIGLVCVPQAILKAQKGKKIVIHAKDSETQYTYSFERLNLFSITYVSIGSQPYSEYEILVGEDLRVFWPSKVEGINANGNLFDGKTRKKLIDDTAVQIGETYYLLTTRRNLCSNKSVKIDKITEKAILWCSWCIYEVKATAFTQEAARFFSDFHCTLTEAPMLLQLVWPLYIETPYLIKHNGDYIWMHFKGENGITIKTYPEMKLTAVDCNKGNGKLIKVNCSERQQLVSVGRTKVLNYTYLWKEKLDEISVSPQIKVVDIHNLKITPGQYFTLPDQKKIIVIAPFDGSIIVSKKDDVVKKYVVKAEENIVVDNIDYDYDIQILQGLDIMWSVSYRLSKLTEDIDEMAVLRRLKGCTGNYIFADHSVGAMIPFLKNYPRIKKWLYRHIRQGKILQDAIRYLKRYVINK